MSQIGANFIDPIAPSAQRGIEGVRDNLNQEGNRVLERAKLQAQTAIAKAQLDAEQKLAEARMEHDSMLAEKQQEFLSTQQGKEIAASDRRAQLQLSAQQQEADKQRQFDTDRDNKQWQRQQELLQKIQEGQANLLTANAEEAEKYAAEVEKDEKELSGLQAAIAAKELDRANAAEGQKIALDKLTEEATKLKAGKLQVYTSALEVVENSMVKVGEDAALNKKEGLAGVVDRASTPGKVSGGLHKAAGAAAAAFPGQFTTGVAVATSKLGDDIVRGAADWLGFDAGFDPTVLNDAKTFAESLPKTLANNLTQFALPGQQEALEPALQQFVGALTKASFAAGSNPQATNQLVQEVKDATAKLQTVLPDDAIEAIVDGIAKEKERSKDRIRNDKFSKSEKKNISSGFEKLGNAKGVFKSAIHGMPFSNKDQDLTRPIEVLITTKAALMSPVDFEKELRRLGFSDENALKSLMSAKERMGKDTPAEIDAQVVELERKVKAKEAEMQTKSAKSLAKGMRNQAAAAQSDAAKMLLGR